MEILETRDRAGLEVFLRKDPYLHFYELGDLQDKLFPNARWFVITDRGEITAAALLYTAKEINVFYLLEDSAHEAAKELLAGISGKLPGKIYCLLSPYLMDVISEKYSFEKPVSYDKMKLTGDIFIGRNIKYPEYTYRINSNDAEALSWLSAVYDAQGDFDRAADLARRGNAENREVFLYKKKRLASGNRRRPSLFKGIFSGGYRQCCHNAGREGKRICHIRYGKPVR